MPDAVTPGGQPVGRIRVRHHEPVVPAPEPAPVAIETPIEPEPATAPVPAPAPVPAARVPVRGQPVGRVRAAGTPPVSPKPAPAPVPKVEAPAPAPAPVAKAVPPAPYRGDARVEWRQPTPTVAASIEPEPVVEVVPDVEIVIGEPEPAPVPRVTTVDLPPLPSVRRTARPTLPAPPPRHHNASHAHDLDPHVVGPMLPLPSDVLFIGPVPRGKAHARFDELIPF